MTSTALLIADAGSESGLGHLSRLSAIAVALRCRDFETLCLANGETATLDRGGVRWLPWSAGDPLPDGVDVVVLDSYRLQAEATLVERVPPLVLLHDHGDVSEKASLVVSVATSPSDDRRWLTGLTYAALRPAYWGLPPRTTSRPLERVLVTTGGSESSQLGLEVAQAVARAFPAVSVSLARGPFAPKHTADGVEVLDAPDSLAEQQLAADLVICGAGQTMLEAAACGTPCLALVLTENQRAQALRLASVGGAHMVDPPEVAAVLDAVIDLASDAARRRDLSSRAQQAVDGYGALRVAFHVEALLRRAP